MQKQGVTVLLLALSAAVALSAEVHYLTAGGSWASTQVVVREGRVELQISPEMAPGGRAIIVFSKPDWMVLDDTAPPELVSVSVDGRTVDAVAEGISLGSLGGETAEVVISLRDDNNPVAADAALDLEDPGSVRVALDGTGLGPPGTDGNMIINLSGLSVGHYQGALRVRDLAPISNSASWPFDFTVMGISVDEDGQTVRLANSAGAFEFEPGLNRQIELPVGQRLYLTGSLRGWVYPRELTDVEVLEDGLEQKTVLIRSTALEDNKREPVPDGRAKIEYELTIRSDTPCLLVTSRLYNIGEGRAGASFFWGWLSGAHFATSSEERRDWEGQAQDAYLDIGHVGWVWLAPRREGQPGVVWMSDGKFVESRFNTMILRSSSAELPTDEFVELQFAVGLADSPDEAARIYEQLLESGLIPETLGGE